MKTILQLLAAVSTFAMSATGQGPSVLRHSIPPPPDVQAYENFGYSVATSGGFTAVGAPFHSGPGEDIGLVKVFNSATGALLQMQFAANVATSVERVTLERSYHVATLDYDAPLVEASSVAFAKRVCGLS